MKSVTLIYYSLVSFPTAGLAWGLMWVTDRLYESPGALSFLAVPIRIITFLMQIGVLLGCLVTVVGIVLFTASLFYEASRGKDLDSGSKLSVKGYMLLLLLPVAMGVADLLIELFNNWLNFNEHGLGLITFGYMALGWVLVIGSLVITGVWLVILPIFLHKRSLSIRTPGLDKRGLALIHKLTISPSEAANGTKKLLTRKGKRLEVIIPAGVKNGTLVKLSDALQITDGQDGDILIKIIVKSRNRIVIAVVAMVVVFIVISSLIIFKIIPISSHESDTSLSSYESNVILSPTFVQLPTGTYIVNNMFGGLGELKIDNGLDLDAVAVLSIKGSMTPQTAVYIRGNTSCTIKGIEDNVYVLYFVIGKNWDNDFKKFIEKPIYQRFEDEFNFTTTLDEYSTWEVTLNPVFGGEAKTISLNEDKFPSLN